MLIDTGAKCVFCRNAVVANASFKTALPLSKLGVGEDAPGFPSIESFHCSNMACGLLYEHPPGFDGKSIREKIISTMLRDREACCLSEE